MTLAEKIMELLNKAPQSYTTTAIRRVCQTKNTTLFEQLKRLQKVKKVRIDESTIAPSKGVYWRSTKWDPKEAPTMDLESAKAMLERGARFGDVYPLLSPEDQETLRYWFVRTDNLPNLSMRTAQPQTSSGNICKKCGGMLVRTGTCETCQDCGENEGCG